MTKQQTGFTLIEAIVTMVILSILVTMITTFIKIPIDSYFNTVQRAEMAYAADSVMQRITRDLRNALPNSLRGSTDLNTQCIEFIPTIAGGSYRRVASDSGMSDGQNPDDILDFASVDSSFDTIASQGLPTINTGAVFFAVVNNLGQGMTGADAYEVSATPNNNNRAPIASITHHNNNTANITLGDGGNQFPTQPDQSSRFQIIPNFSVVYSCQDGRMRRTTRTISNNSALPALTSCPNTGDVLAENITDSAGNPSCSFDLDTAVLNNADQVSIRLSVSRNNETVNLYQEIYVSNQP